jgi:hypothetical protein
LGQKSQNQFINSIVRFICISFVTFVFD